MFKKNFHIPVMSKELINALNLEGFRRNGIYVDCTFGDGGHSRLILEKINERGRLFSLDWDEEVFENYSSNKLDKIFYNNNFSLIKCNFSEVDKFLSEFSVFQVDGIIFDLGISTSQLFNENRGFSYRVNSKLDMRINREKNSINAWNLINEFPLRDLSNIFFEFGEENKSKKIAEKICYSRSKKSINSTSELSNIVSSCFINKKNKLKHPSKKIFQAMRIFINKELENIFISLKKSSNLLKKNGKIIVISYHSIEDRIVKRVFRQIISENNNFVIVNKKPIFSSREEIDNNNSSRSAKMRILEKVN